jgi:hypothetical protein
VGPQAYQVKILGRFEVKGTVFFWNEFHTQKSDDKLLLTLLLLLLATDEAVFVVVEMPLFVFLLLLALGR